MGHQANFILLDNVGGASGGSYRLFHSRWAALSIPQIVFSGPDSTRRFIESLPTANEWLTDATCEGGVLMDLRRRVLLLFGGDEIAYEKPLQAMFLKMLKSVWPSWRRRWAYEGLVDLARYVGKSVAEISDSDRHSDEDWLEDWESTSEDADCWVTLRSERGVIHDYRIDSMGRGVAALSCQHLPLLKASSPCRIPLETDVSCGAFIDYPAREVTVWDSAAIAFLERRLAVRWPGWRIDRQRIGWRLQLEQSQRRAEDRQASANLLAQRIVDILSGAGSFADGIAHRLVLTYQDQDQRNALKKDFARNPFENLSDQERHTLLQQALVYAA